jgi:hypothetical protein
MNHRFQRNNNISEKYWITSWELVIILDNEEILYTQTIFRNYKLKYYFVRGYKNSPEVTEYLVSNDICTIYEYGEPHIIFELILNPHILLELI